jgi:nitrogen regulatory protein PII
MKAIMIVYNQAHTEKIEYLLDQNEISGYTKWNDVVGRGTNTGEPRLGTHTWPEMNSATLAIVEDNKVAPLLERLKKLDDFSTEVGLRAFVWEISQSY